jgi:hypothetical protein
MQMEPAIITYVYAEPFEKSLRIIRSTLREVQLTISWEYEVASKIKQKLGVGLAPCTILYVDCPFLLLEALAFDGRAAAIFPFHVVVSGHGSQTKVHLLSPAHIHNCEIPPGLKGPIRKLHCLILMALEKAASHQGVCQLV